MSVVIKDDNHIPEIIMQLEHLKDYHVRVGILGGGEIGMIAGVQEFGAHIVAKNPSGYLWIPTKGENGGKDGVLKLREVTIPERSFIRSTFAEKQGEWNTFAEKLIFEVANGSIGARMAYQRLGERMARDIRNKIKSTHSPANAPLTINNKGSSSPLIDTGRLRQSVTYEVI
ncbi:hypothetical protein ESZ50_04730 [Weissella muntiaci]|uniref:Uncharacterized protein n=1 Tax=Weissella muntiaci TaxID=2508881 RepID=A0A6C2C7D1_9LACO|nr:hypothetical protein [Weissella muntiaci]TYC49900.1 hypothetical protein ESZ50_04730 [Weissella muntiaci]